MIIELECERRDGEFHRTRIDIEAPQGMGALIALGATLGIERLLGLTGGRPVAPGLDFPERIIDPAHALRRPAEFGGEVRRPNGASGPL